LGTLFRPVFQALLLIVAGGCADGIILKKLLKCLFGPGRFRALPPRYSTRKQSS